MSSEGEKAVTSVMRAGRDARADVVSQRTCPAPTPAERDAAIAAIVEAACPMRPRPLAALMAAARACTPRMLLFGVEESVFLAVLVAAVGLVPAAWAARQPEHVATTLFVVSPLLYASLQGLCAWRDVESGTLAWRMACRVTPAELGAVRMLAFGAVSVVGCVPAAFALWLVSARAASLTWLVSVACASAMVYAVMSLALLRRRSGALPARRTPLHSAGASGVHLADQMPFIVPPVLWAVCATVLASIPGAGAAVLGVPAIAFALIACAAAAVFVRQLGQLASASGALAYDVQ